MIDLTNVKVGDTVLLKNTGYSNERLEKVDKVTKTQIHAGNIRFRISDGYEVGSDGWGRACLKIPTEEDVVRIKKKDRTRVLVSFIKTNVDKCPLEDLEEIYKIIKHI